VADKQGTSRPRIIAFGSGKGGVGKSLVAANLGIFLATLGKRVALIDCAFGAPTAHAFVGVQETEHSLSESLMLGRALTSDLIQKTPVPGLDLVAGCLDPPGMTDLGGERLTQFLSELEMLPYDYVMLDLGSGTDETVADLLLAADGMVVVLSPDPPSIELGYRLLRTVFLRRLEQLGIAPGIEAVEYQTFAGGLPGPLDIWQRAVESGSEERAAKIQAAMMDLKPLLCINQVRSKADIHLGRAMASYSRRVLGLPVRFLGHIEYDDVVWVALRRSRPLLVEHPESRVARCIEKVTRALLARESEKPPKRAHTGLPENYYQLFDLVPDASDEDLRRANRRARMDCAPDSILVRGLYTRTGLEAQNRKLEEAYATLMDPVRRKAYDQELYPEGVPVTPEPKPGHVLKTLARKVTAGLPPMPVIDPTTHFTGAFMREVREAHGLALREIAEQTKISMTYLDAIESESFDKLPATVYVRGFLTEYARMLELDVGRVLDSYLPRYLEERQVRHSS
jgi:flagellar biosynthesis protein FlhG